MKYHNLKLKNPIRRNFKILLCRLFGHRINENPHHPWCNRCGLAYGEAYKPLDWFYMTGITKETKPIIQPHICNHPSCAIIYYADDGHGEDECTLCGTKQENLNVSFN